MPLVIADRVRETSTTVGTGTFTLAGVVPSYQSFAAIGNGNTVYYTIVNQSADEWEVGIGTYTASGTTLSRGTVLSSSNGGSLVNFGAGTKDVWGDYPAGKAVTTDTLAYPPVIGNTTPNAATFTTLTATEQTSLGGAAGAESFRATSVASAVNWVQAAGAITSGAPFLSSQGADTNIAIGVTSKGTSAINFLTNNGNQRQAQITHTASAVNFVQVTGAATGGAPILSSQGSDTNVGLFLTTKGTGSVRITNSGSVSSPALSLGANNRGFYDVSGAIGVVGGGWEQARFGTVGNTVNYWNISGSATNTAPVLNVAGTDTNISMAFQSKGTGGISLSTGSTGTNLVNGTTVTAITRTAAGNGYTSVPSVAISAPTTAGGVQATATVSVTLNTAGAIIASGGTGYSVNDVITVSGGTGTAIQLTVAAVSSGVITSVTITNFGLYTVAPASPASVTGGTGAGATFNLSFGISTAFTITNAGSGYVEQPTVTFSGGGGSGAAAYATVGSGTVVRSLGSTMDFYTPNAGIAMRIEDVGSGVSSGYFRVRATTGAAQLLSTSSLSISSSGANNVSILTNGLGSEQLRVSHTASAVNYVQVTGGATGGSPVISMQGSDSAIPMVYAAKGGASHQFFGSTGGSNQFQISNTSSAVNRYQATGSTTGNGVVFSAVGSDTNVSAVFQSKGTGAIDLAAGSSGVNISNGGTVTAITGTAAGTGYTSIPSVAISAPTTAGGVQATATAQMQFAGATPTVVSGGTGYTAGDVLTVVGGTGTAATITVNTVSGGVITAASYTTAGTYSALPSMPFSVSGGTGNGATFNGTFAVRTTAFTITNAGSGYVEQPTVTFSGGGGSGAAAYATVGSGSVIRSLGQTGTSSLSFFTPSGEVLRLRDTGSTGTYVMVNTIASGANLVAQGATNATFGFNSNGTSAIQFGTNGNTGNTQMQVAHTASAVNFVQVTGAATGGLPTISAQGSDTNVAMFVTSKGNGTIRFATNNAAQTQLRISHTTSAVNFLNVTGSIAGAAPVVSVDGNDTNIDLALTPKGTGNVRFGTYTGTILTPTGFIEIKDSGGTIRRLLVG